MNDVYPRPRSYSLAALKIGLLGLSAVLLLVYYLLPLRAGETEFAWWTPILIGTPLFLGLLLNDDRPPDFAPQLSRRRWRDPRLPSAQER